MSRALLLVSLVAVVACQDPVSSSPVVAMPSPLMAVSAPEVTSEWVELQPATIVGQCTNEAITISGRIHVVTKIWQGADLLRIQSHTNINIAAVGLSSGRAYRYQSVGHSDHEIDLTTSEATARSVFHFQLISQGAAPNYYLTMNATYHFSSAGVEIIPGKWETVCR